MNPNTHDEVLRLDKKDRLCASLKLLVPFYDVDSMDIVWHGHYLKYFEKARCAFLELIDYNYQVMRDSGYIWPVVDTRVKYIKPLHFNQRVRVNVELLEWENRLKLAYTIYDIQTDEKLSSGYSVQVAVNKEEEELQFLLPQSFRESVQNGIKKAVRES